MTQAGLVNRLWVREPGHTPHERGQSGDTTVRSQAVPVGSVTIGPDSARTSATLAVGDSLSLLITLRDAQGNVLTGRNVTYRAPTRQ